MNLTIGRRCIATRRDAPAVIWHVGFWPRRKQDPQDAPSTDEFNHRLDDWINEGIQPLVDRLLAMGQPPDARLPRRFAINKNHYLNDQHGTNDDNGAEADKLIEIWTATPKAEEFDIAWHGLKVQVRVEIHPDYATCTFIIALGDGSGAMMSSGQPDEVSHFRQAVQEATRDDQKLAAQASSTLFGKIWRKLVADISASSGNDGPIFPGEIFVSLRGVVLELDETDESGGEMVSVMNAKPRASTDVFGEDTANDALEKFQYFLSRGGFEEDDREFVAARIVQGRAIFISPLGSRSLHNERDDPDLTKNTQPRRSTRFAVLTKGRLNSRQIGRIVAQIANLGTLQIIALKDVRTMRAVGTAVRLQDDYLDACGKELKQAIESRRFVPSSLEVRLCQLESKLDSIANLPTGGLAYRIFRSKYYANEFDRRLRNLGATPIPKWQTPEIFYAKRLFSVFDYVQNVGGRMDELRRRISDTLETVQTTTLVDLTQGVHRLQTSGEILSFILFIVAVSTFTGEVWEPVAYQAGFPTFELVPAPEGCANVTGNLPDACKAAFRLNGYVLGFIAATILTLIFVSGRSLFRNLVGGQRRS